MAFIAFALMLAAAVAAFLQEGNWMVGLFAAGLLAQAANCGAVFRKWRYKGAP